MLDKMHETNESLPWLGLREYSVRINELRGQQRMLDKMDGDASGMI